MSNASVIREWLVCTFAGFLLFFLGILIPPLAPFLVFFYVFPPALLSYERGIWPAVGSVFAVSILLPLFLPVLLTVVYPLVFGLSGILLGILLRKIKAGGDLLLAGIVVSLLCKLLAALVVWRITGFNVLAPDAAEMEKMLLTFSESPLASLPGNDMMVGQENLKATIQSMIALIPFTIIVFSTIEVILCYYMVAYVHKKRTGEEVFSLPPFAYWTFPKNLLFALVVGFFCELFSLRNPELRLLRQTGANLNAVTRTLFIVQGLSVTWYLMEVKRVPRFFRVALLVMTPMIAILGSMFSLVGIIDIGFDLRKRMRRNEQ